MPRILAPTSLALAAALTLAAAPAPARVAGLDDAGHDDDHAPAPRVVIGTTDTGINPYHAHFKVDEPAVTPAVLAEFGIDEDHVIEVGDSYEEDLADGVYDDVVPGEDYWFAGTNLIARPSDDEAPFIADEHPHGVGVTAAMVATAPEAVVFFVEDFDVEAVFSHPSVDVVTTSFGVDHGLPPELDFGTGAPLFPFEAAHRAVLEDGKLFLAATPNRPTPSQADAVGGPWWSISVSGWEEYGGEGKQFFSAQTPDVVADYLQRLPWCATCTEEYRDKTGGTSFATPRAGGVVATALLELRRAAGHLGGITDGDLLVDGAIDGVPLQLTNWDVRRALEVAAAPLSSPLPGEQTPEHVFGDGTLPVLGPGSQVQVGWGLVTDDPDRGVLAELTAQLGLGTPTRTKPADVCAWMTALIDARAHAYAANPTSPSFGDATTEEYQRC